ATCLVLGRAARRLTGSEVAAAAAPWLALLASQCEVPSVSTELLMALPAAGALLFYARRDGRRARRCDSRRCLYRGGVADPPAGWNPPRGIRSGTLLARPSERGRSSAAAAARAR